MALPKAIEDMQAQADQIQAAIDAEVNGAQPAAEDPPVQAVPSQSDAPQPQAVPVQPVQNDEGDWKQRYLSLQGMFNSQIGQLQAQLRQQMEISQQLTQRLNEKPTPAPEKPAPMVTDKDEKAFGADLLDVMRRVAQEEFARLSAPILAEMERRLAPVQEQVGSVAQRQQLTAVEQFWAALDAAVPDWKDINTNPSWIQWLEVFDPIAGKSRQDALNEAQQANDARRVVAMFNLWKAQNQAPAQAQASQARKELARQAAPAKSAGGVPSQPAAQKIWSIAEYQAVYDPRLKNTHTAQEIAALQAEADKALEEGRVHVQ